MTPVERLLSDLLRMLGAPADDWRHHAKKRGRLLLKLLKVGGLLLLTAILIPLVMIPTGLLLGPNGTEGLLAAPLAVFTAWAVILYWALRKPRVPTLVASTDLARLPAQTENWLDHQRTSLPGAAQSSIDGITRKLAAITPQLLALDPR